MSNLLESLIQLSESYHNYFENDSDKKAKDAQEVFNMIHTTYGKIGGVSGSGFNSPDDMVQNIPFWKVHKKNGKIKSVTMYKDNNGRKAIISANDGTKEGVMSQLKMMSDELKHKRSYAEFSGKPISIMKKISGDIRPFLIKRENVSEILGKDVHAPAEDDIELQTHPELKEYLYSRTINGHTHTKIMGGKPFLSIK